MIMYRVSESELKALKVVAQTRTQVTFVNELGEIKQNKKADSWAWGETPEEAKEILISQLQDNIEVYETKINYIKNKIKRIKSF